MKRLIWACAPLLVAACITRPAPPTEPVTPNTVAGGDIACDAESFTVYFEEGQTSLSEEAGAMLDTVATSFARCDLYRMEIEGHADANGPANLNQTVSEARAKTVMDALHDRNIDAERVRVIAFGEKGATTATGEAKPLNRRTEVRLIPEADKVS